MAAYCTAVSRACSHCRKLVLPLLGVSRKSNFLNSHAVKFHNNEIKSFARLVSTSQSDSTKSEVPDQPEYPADFEVSYDEFKYVEQVLPLATVPDVPDHEIYPTPSGWFPPNDELRSKQSYLVRRTKNHMLPVYTKTERSWKGTSHFVVLKRIEGDIWSLEAQLREHLIKETGLKQIKTQVHEVGRFMRVRGLHAPMIAEFLLQRGM